MLNFNPKKTISLTFDSHQILSDLYPVKKVFELLMCRYS